MLYVMNRNQEKTIAVISIRGYYRCIKKTLLSHVMVVVPAVFLGNMNHP